MFWDIFFNYHVERFAFVAFVLVVVAMVIQHFI